MGKAERIHLRGRPSDAYKAKLREPTQADWVKLEAACITAMANGSKSVWIDFDYTLEIPKDFPKSNERIKSGKIIEKSFNAKLVLQWMNKHGLSCITPEQVLRVINRFNELERALEVK